jgi:nitrate reductase gamma subunit
MKSELLKNAELISHITLIVMALIYTIRIFWLLKYKAGKERQPKTGSPDTTPKKGYLYSWAMIAMPWAMESYRKHFLIYLQFALFHLGVTAAIALTFIIPYAPALLKTKAFFWIMYVLIWGAFVVGVIRIFRRIGSKYLRAISTPDDYFSLILLTVWFFFAGLSVPNDISKGETHMLMYFFMTTFFLIYVPFSKISHYLYYPFTRYYFGKSMGRRGVYPVKRG